MSVTTPARGRITSGDKWKAPRPTPVKLIVLALVAVLALGVAGWWSFLRPTPPPPAPVDTAPKAVELSAVDVSGVSTLLNQFATEAREIRGEVTDGSLKAKIINSVTGDGKFGFGTLNAANIDGSALLADGVTYMKGSPTFWSALGVQTNFPGWVHVHPDFLGGRIFYPAHTVLAQLAPVEESRILGDEYTANPKASATFGFNGLESVRLDGYTISVLPANNDGVAGTAIPMRDALGAPAVMERSGSAWTVNPPAP